MDATYGGNKKLSIYPDDDARRIVGGNSPACNRAIACWARVLRESQPDLSRAEWNFLADVLNGTLVEPAAHHGPAALALEVHDAQALNGTGDRWFADELRRGSGQEATDRLLAKIKGFSWQQCEYVTTACAFFWSHTAPGEIDHQVDPWWTVEFRCRLLRGGEVKGELAGD
jgi:hypothetical protein